MFSSAAILIAYTICALVLRGNPERLGGGWHAVVRRLLNVKVAHHDQALHAHPMFIPSCVTRPTLISSRKL